MYTFKELSNKVSDIFASEDFTDQPRNLYEPISYTLSLGGKRLRPTLLLAAVDLFGGDIDDASNAAIGIEMLHNFTLLHDDLMDKSPLRRGKPTVYTKWDGNTAILSGDALLTLAWRYMLKKERPNMHKILNIFNETCMDVCEGQQYDMDFESRDDVSIDEYLLMISLKTSAMLTGALHIGALCTDADESEVQKLITFGTNIGQAFQLRDDLLDAYGDTGTFGKQTGTDIKDNKKTILYLMALQDADETKRERLHQLFATTPENPDSKIREVLEIYSSLGIREKTEAMIADYHDRAVAALKAIERPDESKKALQELVTKLVARNV